MFYCSCGGQKNCYRCDGKGWLDEAVEGGAISTITTNLPPVLAEYSQPRNSGFEKVDSVRRKPLITQLYADTSAPKKPTAKSRKNHSSSWQVFAKLIKKGKKPSKTENTFETAKVSVLTQALKEHEREVALLSGILPSAGDATEAVQRRIKEERRVIRKLRIKAKKTTRRARAATKRDQ